MLLKKNQTIKRHQCRLSVVTSEREYQYVRRRVYYYTLLHTVQWLLSVPSKCAIVKIIAMTKTSFHRRAEAINYGYF